MAFGRLILAAMLLVMVGSRAALAQAPPAPVNYAQFFDTLFAPATQAVAANGGPTLSANRYGGAALLASLLASQMVSLPTGSNAGGFSWKYEPGLGVWTRAVDSFGPQTTERAQTIGRNKINLGFTQQRFTFDHLDGDAISVASAGLVSSAPVRVLSERVSLSRADVALNTVFVNYGVSSRLEAGVLLPIMSASFDGNLDFTLRADGPNGPILAQGANTATARERRLGDPVLRAKWNFVQRPSGGVALGYEGRLPSRNQLGAEGFQLLLIASGATRGVNVHMNTGFSSYSCNVKGSSFCREISGYLLRGGVDKAVSKRVTLATDLQMQRVQVDLRDRLTLPENAELARGGSETNNGVTIALTGKVRTWGNLLVTLTGIVRASSGGLTDRFTPIIGIDYAR